MDNKAKNGADIIGTLYMHWSGRGDFYITESLIGWNSLNVDNAVGWLGTPDPFLYYMEIGIDIGFYYKGHQYWIESPAENLRNYGGEVWSIGKCEIPNPDWDGKYAYKQYLGWGRHDAIDRTEICHYDGIEEFLANAKIDGVPIREVMDNAYISDL